MANALVPLADGCEEMEAVIIVDVLRRGGWRVVAAGVTDEIVRASRGVRLLADMPWSRVDPDEFDLLVLPGGAGGTAVLSEHPAVLETVRCFVNGDRIVGAICAGPLVLQAAAVTEGRTLTCHPAVRADLTTGNVSDERVVVDRPLVTSQGPGTAMEFALELLRLVDGDQAAADVAAGLVLPQASR